MASTRNKNTYDNYCLEQRNHSESDMYIHYKYSQYGQSYKNGLPDLGITPSHLPRDILSHNAVDIETSLFGIGSTNLVNKQKEIMPELKDLNTINYFDRIPLILPEPLIVEKNQRPFPRN